MHLTYFASFFFFVQNFSMEMEALVSLDLLLKAKKSRITQSKEKIIWSEKIIDSETKKVEDDLRLSTFIMEAKLELEKRQQYIENIKSLY